MSAVKILILGESGTGKTTSLRNLDKNTTAIVNPGGKPMPFRGKFTHSLDGDSDAGNIARFMGKAVADGCKVIIVDDFQFILSLPYFRRIRESGWNKFNDFGGDYFTILDACNALPSDVTVYFMSHVETVDDVTQIKLIGKVLREKISIEGLFSIVLRTAVIDGSYLFLTQNSGKDTVKSPMGMFDSYAIENDLKFVDERIRNYYEIGEFLSDEAMATASAEAAVPEVEMKGGKARKSRKANMSIDEMLESEETDPSPAPVEEPVNAEAQAEFDANLTPAPRQRKKR